MAVSHKYEGRIVLKAGTGSSATIQVTAESPSKAKQLIEAQYAGQIKHWTQSPKRVR